MLLLCIAPLRAFADDITPALQIRELNITGDEFVVLQNAGTLPLELNDYWLGYNSDDAASYVVPTQQLPSAELQPGESILLNTGATSTCDASIVDRLGFSSFSNTKGVLQLRLLTNTGVNSTFTTVDSVAWGKLPGDPIQIADEKGLSDGATAVWYRDVTDSQALWQVGSYADCSLTLLPPADEPDQESEVISWPQNSASPPSIYVGVVSTTKTSSPTVPAVDRGLKAPQLSEILPNPASPQTDASDEFIELYNPNSKPFDLSGFTLQTASTSSTTTHSYHFPAGTVIAPGAFMAFKSAQTHLSLGNSGGQVWLIDPLGTTLDSCEPYGTAKDAQAWIDASGKWQWTVQPTPGSTNKVAVPAVGSTKAATVNGKKVTTLSTSSNAGKVNGASTIADQTVAAPLSIHPLTLAVIILAALLYGAYEYRYDMALKYQQLRRNRTTRR